MHSFRDDLTYALRMARRSPVVTAVVILSLGIGLGANIAVFSFVDAALLRELPVPEPEALAVFGWVWVNPGGMAEMPDDMGISGWMLEDDAGRPVSSSFSYRMYERMRDTADAFEQVFAFAPLNRLNVVVGGEGELASGQAVSGTYYDGLELRASHGRLLGAGDDRDAAEPAAVLSHGYWERRFGADPEVLGTVIRLNGSEFTVVGVGPPRFRGALHVGDTADVTVPLAFHARVAGSDDRRADPTRWWMYMMARLRPGVSRAAALARTSLLFRNSANADLELDPAADSFALELRRGALGLTERRDTSRQAIFTLTAVVALVLLIACVNVANLLLARAASRQWEIAVRMSLGARRTRLVRQLLTESTSLALVAATAGLVIGVWIRGLLVSAVLPSGAANLELAPLADPRLLAFTFGLALVTGLLFGVAPAIRASRPVLTPALKGDQSRQTSRGRPRLGLTKALLTLQVGMSLVLLIGAGLFTRSLGNLVADATNFDPRNVLLFRVDPTLTGLEGAQLVELYDDLLRGLKALPGVRAATLANHEPVSGTMSFYTLKVDGYEPGEDEPTRAFGNLVGPEFFEAFEVPLVLGRGLDAGDTIGRAQVAVINEALAERYFPGENPVGKRIGLGRNSNPTDIEVVGVAKDVKYQILSDPWYPAVHVPYMQYPDAVGSMRFALRTEADPARLSASVRRLVQEIAPRVPVFDFQTHVAQIGDTLTQERMFARLSGMLSGVALLLACMGLYGILSYALISRTREIGVRMALGARDRNVVALVARELVPVLVGIVLGLVAAIAGTRTLASQLYELEPSDPLTMSVATLMLAGVAVIAAWLPARRASRVDPLVSLRVE